MFTDQPDDRDPPSSRGAHPETTDVWLDLLPIDVCSQIASLLPLYERREDDRVSTDQIEDVPSIFPLAAVSKTQRRAIALSQRAVLRIHRVNDCCHAENIIRLWRSILGTDIREAYLPINAGVGPQVCDLLSFPGITKAALPNFPRLLRALLSQHSVRELDLQVTSFVPLRGENGLYMLSQVLQSCPVEKLSLACHGCGGPSHRDNFMCTSMPAILRFDCTATSHRLRSLRLSCPSRRFGSFSHLLLSFPSLEEFCWECTHPAKATGVTGLLRVPRSLRPRLRSFKSISFIHAGPLRVFAEEIGEAITSISARQIHDMSQLKLLEKCPRIASIDLFLAEGAEAFFPTSLTTLSSISLSWYGRGRTQEEGYYTPQPEQLATFVRRNNQVQELRFRNVKLSISLLRELLSNVGECLQVLQIPICRQGDSPICRVLQVIRLTIKHNPNLQELCFDASELNDWGGNIVGSMKIFHVHENASHSDDCEYCELRNLIDVWRPILKRWLPGLRENCLEELKLRLKPYFRRD